MPVFGNFKASDEPTETEAYDHVSRIWKAQRVDVRSNRRYAVKTFSVSGQRISPAVESDKLAGDLSLNFLNSVKQLKRAHSDGGRCLIPSYEFDNWEEGAWYATDFYTRQSLKLWINSRGSRDDLALRRVAGSVVAGCLDLKRSCGRSHGNIKPANLLLGGEKPRSLDSTDIFSRTLTTTLKPMPKISSCGIFAPLGRHHLSTRRRSAVRPDRSNRLSDRPPFTGLAIPGQGCAVLAGSVRQAVESRA